MLLGRERSSTTAESVIAITFLVELKFREYQNKVGLGEISLPLYSEYAFCYCKQTVLLELKLQIGQTPDLKTQINGPTIWDCLMEDQVAGPLH